MSKLLKTLLAPMNYYGSLCYKKEETLDYGAGKTISFLYCPFVSKDNFFCDYFEENIIGTKYDAFFRCDKCIKTFGNIEYGR